MRAGCSCGETSSTATSAWTFSSSSAARVWLSADTLTKHRANFCSAACAASHPPIGSRSPPTPSPTPSCSSTTSALNFGIHALGIHGWFGDAIGLSINESFWFITLIVSLYGLYLWFRRLRSSESLLLAGGLVTVAVAFAFFFTGQSAMFAHLGLRLPGFVLGILLGRLLRDGQLTIGANATLGAAAFILVYVPYTQGIVFHTAVAGLALVVAYTLWLRPALPAAVAVPVQRMLTFLGSHSLEIFLIHQPLLRDYNTILQIRWFHVTQPTPITLAVGMIVALAVTLFLAVELRRLLHRLLG
jgi:peptidoglycan/LPS O-acetylase OafA/YrhL